VSAGAVNDYERVKPGTTSVMGELPGASVWQALSNGANQITPTNASDNTSSIICLNADDCFEVPIVPSSISCFSSGTPVVASDAHEELKSASLATTIVHVALVIPTQSDGTCHLEF